MKCISDPVEFRGCEKKSFTNDDGKNVEMTVLRFDDETGQQNEFYIFDESRVGGIQSLVRGGIFLCELNIGRGNKAQLLQVIEK